ncbi:hypothetical protein EJB05_00505, partial [Eragrostis curvula]
MAPRGGRAAATVSSGSEDEEEAGFSRSYFLAKEKEPSSGKKRARAAAGKLSDLNLVDEQVLRASLAEIPPKSLVSSGEADHRAAVSNLPPPR